MKITLQCAVLAAFAALLSTAAAAINAPVSAAFPDGQEDEPLVLVRVEAWSDGALVPDAELFGRGIDPDRPWLESLEPKNCDGAELAREGPGTGKTWFTVPEGARIGLVAYGASHGCTEIEITVRADSPRPHEPKVELERPSATVRIDLPHRVVGADTLATVDFGVNSQHGPKRFGIQSPVVVRSPRFGCPLLARDVELREGWAPDVKNRCGTQLVLPPGSYRLTYEELPWYFCGNTSPIPQERTFVEQRIELLMGQRLAVEGTLAPGVPLRLMLHIPERAAEVEELGAHADTICTHHWSEELPQLPGLLLQPEHPRQLGALDLLATVTVRPLGDDTEVEPTQCGNDTMLYALTREMVPIGQPFFTSRSYSPGSYDVTVRGPGIVTQTVRVEVPETETWTPARVIDLRPRR